MGPACALSNFLLIESSKARSTLISLHATYFGKEQQTKRHRLNLQAQREYMLRLKAREDEKYDAHLRVTAQQIINSPDSRFLRYVF